MSETDVDYDLDEEITARLVESAESIASSLERIVELIENGIDKEDRYDHDHEEYDDDEEGEEHTNLFAGMGGIRGINKGFEDDKSRPEKGEKRN
tara:strand:+ start:168 stop:449 length:282 start_codon:yes stop_codon:yes gene_type:complete